jgi:hypothetical protein
MTTHYLFVAPNVWGKGTSEQEAHKNAHYASKSNGHALLRFNHDDFYVDEYGHLQCEGEGGTILSASKGLGKGLRQSLMNL